MPALSDTSLRDPRGRKPTCYCGTCDKCKYRTRRREYMRDYNAGTRRRSPRTWTLEKDALLGTAKDKDIAQYLGLTSKAVSARRLKLGIPRFHAHTNDSGYIIRTLPEGHTYLEMTRSNRQVQEHRLVMAQHLGRPLTRDEFVHHKNGIRSDNRIINLELWSRSHPDGQRVEDKLEWAIEFIERYAREVTEVRDTSIFRGGS